MPARVDEQIVKQIRDLMGSETSISKLAKKAKYDRSKLTNMLNGHKGDINVAVLVRIADALDCDIILQPRSS